ncbi:HalOD1 output domain-containing protein [Halarchaeum sp. P4]|uniref:HalOD1 output domain-containing protein n=1 Tax=Halarchaeum sp. P4 TaxID=3421639 RepID=UPI003EBA7AE9
MNDDGAIGRAVVRAVAEREGVPVEELSQPLYEVVDPEALDALFRANTGRASFEYAGYRVTVTHDGRVDIDARSATSD